MAVFAAQAFHWFDPGVFRREALRILRRPGFGVLVWNIRYPRGNAFTAGYEEFLERWGRNYAAIRARWARASDLGVFFGLEVGDWQCQHATYIDLGF